MKKILIVSLLFVILGSVFADSTKTESVKIVRRIKIQHADAQLIAMLLAGRQNYRQSPEISTLRNNGNGSNNGNGQNNSNGPKTGQ